MPRGQRNEEDLLAENPPGDEPPARSTANLVVLPGLGAAKPRLYPGKAYFASGHEKALREEQGVPRGGVDVAVRAAVENIDVAQLPDRARAAGDRPRNQRVRTRRSGAGRAG